MKFTVTEDGKGTLLVKTFVDGASQGVTQGGVATNALPAQNYANVNHFFTLLGKMFFTPYGKEFFTSLSKQIFTS